MKKLLAALMVVLLLVSAAGCSKGPKMAKEQVLNMTFPNTNLKTNNDFLPPWSDGTILSSLMWRTLIRADADLKAAKDDLMTNWSISDDGLTVKMTLRDGQYWSDGQPITMDDIMFTLEAYCDQYGTASWSYVRSAMNYIEGRDAFAKGEADHVSGITVDGNNLTIKLTQPYASFLNLMCQVAPLPVHIYGDVEKVGFQGNEIWGTVKVTSGMYKVTEHVKGSYFVLEPNEYYKDVTPKIKKIIYRVTSANSTSAQAGESDFFQTNSADDYVIMSGMPDYTLYPVPVIFFRFLVFNQNDSEGVNKGIVDDVRVRKAIAYGVDWKTLVGGLYGDQASFTQSGILSSSEYYAGNWYEYNPEKAKQLLDEAGYDYNHVFKFIYYYSDQTTKDIMDGIIYYLDKLGVKADAVYTTNSSVDIYANRTQDAAYFGLSAYDYLSYYQMFKRGNMQAFMDEGAKKYIDKCYELEKAFTPEEFKKVITELQQWESEDVYFLPVYTVNFQTWIKKNVFVPEGTKFGNNYYFYDFGFENWYITE